MICKQILLTFLNEPSSTGVWVRATHLTSLLSIVADFNYAEVLMVSIIPVITNSSSFFSWFVWTVSSIQRQLVSMSFSYSTVFSGNIQNFVNLFCYFFLKCCAQFKPQNTLYDQFLFFNQLTVDLVFWLGLGDSFL